MKKIIALILCCLIFSGCTNLSIPPTTSVTETTTVEESTYIAETTLPEISVDIFLPDANAEFFDTIQANVCEIHPDLIVALLVEHSMLNPDIALNHAELVDTQLNLDFNQAFLDQLCTYGTSGERMMIGCVVNTFLSAYEAETVYITVNGEIMESGHTIYDFPMKFFE